MNLEQSIREKYQQLHGNLSEQQKRLWAASEALSCGYGGVSIVHRATGLSRPTIHFGIQEISNNSSLKDEHRVRRPGGGRKSVEQEYPLLLKALNKLIEDETRGDPRQPLFWTCKSTQNLASELKKKGYEVSDRTVSRLLHDLHFSLQSNRKSLEGRNAPDRNVQFEYINKKVKEFQEKGQPVISVDTKKKELVGNFKNAGYEWRPVGMPKKVNIHDFESGINQRIKAIPYGIYDITSNIGWVNVGIDHDTAEFAVESIRRWWLKMGFQSYLEAHQLLIIADSGGSNPSKGRLWKLELQKLADETSLEITVCHLPPGTSKWNKIEHRLFCHITKNWRARPLTSYEVIVSLISHTTTKAGLRVFSELDEKKYALAKKVSNHEMKAINLHSHEINGKWNYTVSPSMQRLRASAASIPERQKGKQ
jgi:transposase